MKKHIIGLVLFSFIVSAAAVVHAVFNVPEIVPVYEIVLTPQYVPAGRTHCKMKSKVNQSEISSPIVSQAVFNLKTKKLSWKSELSNIGNITYLHFWAVDEKGIHYIDSISAENLLRGERVITSDWQELNLNKLSSRANLYLIPDTFRNTSPKYTDYRPGFEINKAIAVTIDYGK